MLSLYIHIPFCIPGCKYCAFFKVGWSRKKEKEYLKALARELDFYIKRFPDIKIKTLYIGGGSPSLLSSKALNEMICFLRKKIDFKSIKEKTIELNPNDVTQEKLNILKEAGFDRLSLGVQSMLDRELVFLGRRHNKTDVIKAVELIKEFSFENWNMDLIFGIPGSTVETIRETLTCAMRLSPEHISTYSLSIEQGTEFFLKRIAKVSEDNDLRQYAVIRAFLEKAGYKQYEVSAFAKRGRKCEHNLAYWEHRPFIGLGPGSSSFFCERAYANEADFDLYMRDPEPIEWRKNKAKPYPKKLLIKEFIITNLRLINGFRLDRFKERFGLDFEKEYKRELLGLKERGLIVCRNNRVRVTVKGLYLLDEVLIGFV